MSDNIVDSEFTKTDKKITSTTKTADLNMGTSFVFSSVRGVMK